MLFKKLFRTFLVYKSQFISMIIMITLGVGMFVGFNMEWVSIKENTNKFFEQTHLADYNIVSKDGFDKDDLKKIKNIKGVKDASLYISVSADVKQRDSDSVALTVTDNENVSGFYLVKGEKYDKKSKDGIWLSDKYANANDIKIGDKLTFVYKDIKFKGKVVGLIKSGEHMICVRDASQVMPDYDTYGFAYISPKMYKKAMGIAYYPQINVISNMNKKDFTDKVDEVLDNTSMILTKDENISYSKADGEVEEGQTMGTILPVLFLLIAVLTMITTMHRLSAKEKTQIGTLKALGFKDRRILFHYTSYTFMIGIIGSAIGIVLGYYIARLIMSPTGTMGTYMDMPYWDLSFPQFCYVALIFMIIMLTLIGFLSVKKMLKGTAADALRPYVPKKMKPLLIERTKLFHKFSFDTRWNMRDIIRHKSRSLMSLIGIVGAMILIVASLGMKDTMDSFLDLYYNKATNYSSRIYLSEDATKKQRKDIAEKYGGNWSASVSVQLEEKAVSLDIYNLPGDKVRFLDANSNYINITDDGAYICTRIADEFNLSVGDEFVIKPYGEDDEYTLKVSGITKSFSENIVITKAYAKNKDISYKIDSVYTDIDKKDISSNKRIKEVQSKNMIIDSFDTFIEIMNMMVYLLILGALVLGVVVLYNLGVMSYTERYREMATLKVVGFKDKDIGKLLIEQNLWLSVIGVIIGIPSGIFTLNYLVKKLASEYELNTYVSLNSVIISIVLVVGMSLLVSLMVSRKNKKIDMVEALKGTE